jgi:ankyrin repeat protein
LWEKEPSSTLWVHGIPGCGKTVLCSAAIEALLTKHETSNTSLLAYYFFVFTAREGNATTQFVRSILAQIALQTKHLPMAFQNLFAKHHEGIQQPTNKALVDALRATLDEIGELFLIIDALDECTSRAGLLRILQKLLDWKIPNLHLMLTSRKEKDIEDVLRDMPQIAVQGKEHHQDIRLFVEQRIESEPSLNKWSTKNQAEITSVVLDQAGDMFRLAALHLDELQRCRNLKGLQRTLYTLPTTLDETYTRILRDLPSEHIQDILRVLTWLCHAWQPPTLTELVAVLAVDLDEARYDYNQEYQDPEDIIGICGGLVVSDSADRRRPVRLSHASVKDYLLSGRFVHENFPDFTFDLHHAEVLICKICLVYLHSHSCERVTEAHNKPPTHALVMYATNFWCEHFRCAGDHSDLLELATKLLTDPSSDFMEWAWVCFILPSSIRTEQQPANLSHSETGRKTLLYISALTGSRSLIDRIIDRGADVNELGGECGTPLAAAVMNADPKTVDYLLERGADVNVQGGLFGNALQIACAFGSIKSVELLLERGANPNIHGGSLETALHAAIYEGCRPEETVKLLLNSGADPQLTKHPSATPLCAALIAGDEASLKALLEAGASVKDDSLITALLWGRLHLADLLLRAGASIKQDNSNVGNAFNAAAIGGVAALKFLVDDWQIDAHVSDREGRTALHAAAFSGSVEAVRFLLDLGLQVDTEDRKGWSSVHYAAMADLPAKLAILLPLWTAKQADWNPLHLACRRNQPEALDLLFNAGLRPSTITTRSPPWQWSLFDVAFSHRNRSLVSPEGKPLHSLLVQDEEEPLDRKPPSGPTQISCDGCQLGEVRSVKLARRLSLMI